MFKVLRIVCSIIGAADLAACIFIFVYLGTLWGIVSLIAGAALFGLTVLFKTLQEREEHKNDPPKGDFIHGPSPADIGSSDDKTE